MKKLFLAIIILLTLSSYSMENYSLKDWTKNDYDNCQLLGKVKSVSHTFGKPNQDLLNFSDTIFYKKIDVTFNEYGNLLKITQFNDNSNVPSNSNYYSYNKITNQKNGFYMYDKDEKNIYKSILIYDKSNMISKEVIFYNPKSNIADLEIFYRYNEKKQLIEKITKTVEGVLKSVTKISYDDKKIASIETELDGKIIYSESFKYEKSNLVYHKLKNLKVDLQEEFIYSDNKIISKYESINNIFYFRSYKYDEKGNIDSCAGFDANDTLKFIEKYKYDLKNNWIKKIKFTFDDKKNPKPDEIQIRKIDYFY